MFIAYIVVVASSWVIGLIFFLCFWIHYSIEQDVHKRQTRSNSNMQLVGTYNDFIKQFSMQTWDQRRWQGSYFNYETDSEIHASIIKFNGVGMLMKNMFHLYLVQRFLSRHSKYNESIFPVDYWRRPPEGI